jgi:hypothetical protein
MSDGSAEPGHLDPASVSAYFRAPAPAAFRMSEKPPVQLTIDPGRDELRLITPVAGADPEITAYERLTLRRVGMPDDGREWFELSADAADMHYEAYVLMESIVEQLKGGATLRFATSESIEGLKDLLAKRKRLTDEKVAGLIGELLVLAHVLDSIGEEIAIPAWLGPLAEEHDFGFPMFDAEVKTTLAEARSHVIGSETQLEPVPQRDLFLVSVQITRAGAAATSFTLPELVEQVRTRLEQGLRVFDNTLDILGYRDSDADLYRTRFQLRSVPRAYLVDSTFPAITSALLDEVVPQRSLVGGVSYRVDISHLPFVRAPKPLTDFCEEPE